MTRTVAERLQAGILAAKGGGLDHARELLAGVVIQDPSIEAAWYWLGIILTLPAEKAWCFKRALELNPQNLDARRQLDGLAFEVLRESGVNPEEVSDLDVDSLVAEIPEVVRLGEAAKSTETPTEQPPEQTPAAPPSQNAFTKPFYDEEDQSAAVPETQPQLNPNPGPFNMPIEEAVIPVINVPPPPAVPVKNVPPPPAIPLKNTPPPPAGVPVKKAPLPPPIPPRKTGPLQNRLDDGGIQELRKTITFSEMNTVPEVKSPPRRRLFLFILAGVILILLLGVGAALWLNNTNLPAGAANAASPTPTQQAATATAPAATATKSIPSPTPAPTATLTLQRRVEAIQGAILIAQDHQKAGRYDQAVNAWTDLISRVPDYAGLYLWRAESILAGAEANAKSLDAYIQTLDNAFQDLDQAFLLDSALPGVAGVRARVEMAYARSTAKEAERSTWLALARMHANEAFATREADEEVTLIPYYVLMAQGKCQDAVDELAAADPLGESADTISTGWHTVLAAAYMCAGRNGDALTEINMALVQPTTDRLTLKALIQYNLGSYQEVVDGIDAWIVRVPVVRSDRYYIRALAHMELGKRGIAAEDLLLAPAESWDMDGIGLFVQGRMAAYTGNNNKATSLYRESTNRMRQDYAPLLRRVRNYLAAITGS